jgi:hypothetical protein
MKIRGAELTSSNYLVPALSLIWTALNCFKPVHIDDTLYLLFSRQIASHPLDPYGISPFWFQWPEPAFWLPAPPVFFYWLSFPLRLGIATPWILKLWMFPFALIFTHSLCTLLRRVAGSYWVILAAMTILSPLFVTGLNLMLDVPSQALGLFAVTLFVRAVDGNSARWAVISGTICGLSAMTKWSCLTYPVTLMAYALVHRKPRLGAVSCLIALTLFVSWETAVRLRYGESNFLVNIMMMPHRGIQHQILVNAQLPAYLGGTAPLLMVPALLSLRLPGPAAVSAAVGASLLAGAYYALLSPLLATAVGVATLGAGAIALMPFARGACWHGLPGELLRTRCFLMMWVLIEIAGAIVISPFPASRRVMGIAVAMTLLFGHLLNGMPPDAPRRWTMRFAAIATASIAFFFFWVDLDDATVFMNQAMNANDLIHQEDPLARVWYLGSWGFKYYADQAEMLPAIPDGTTLHAGDWLVVAMENQNPTISFPHDAIAAKVLLSEPWKSSRTVLPLYCGDQPMARRTAAAATTSVFRIKTDMQLTTDPGMVLQNSLMRPRWMPPDALNALVQLLSSPDPRVVITAEHAVLTIGKPALTIAADDSNPAVRTWARSRLASPQRF